MLSRLSNNNWSLRKKLFCYMLVLAILLLFVLFAGILMLGRFDSGKKSINRTLNFQMKIFEKNMFEYFESLASDSIGLSQYLSDFIDNDNTISGKKFKNLTDNPGKIEEIQSKLIVSLAQKLENKNCSGIFVMLNATVNSRVKDADVSRTGIYLQHNRYQNDDDIILFRGNSVVGKKENIMPHRKWRLEFNIDKFPGYDEIIENVNKPLNESYMLTKCTTLAGTSDDVVLMSVPIVGSDGTFYGICGYEISADYFMTYHTQPDVDERIACILLSKNNNDNYIYAGLSCSSENNYVQPPEGSVTIKNKGDGLVRIADKEQSFVGIYKEVSITPNNNGLVFAVIMPKSDYTNTVVKSMLQVVILVLLLIFFAVNCCIYFSNKYLKPIMISIEQIKKKDYTKESSNIPEIDDLFDILAKQDDSTQEELKQTRLEIQRLSYSRKTEIDPENYKMFLEGLKTLTATEEQILNYYMQGKSVKEIMDIAGIKESTIRFHNRNIYSKLNVISLKQLLLYATTIKGTEDNDNDAEEK